MTSIISILWRFLIATPITLLHGYITHLCWSWFIVPKFGGPHLSVVEAIGVTTVIHGIFVTKWIADAKKEIEMEMILKKELEDTPISKEIFHCGMQVVTAGLLLIGLAFAFMWKQFLP